MKDKKRMKRLRWRGLKWLSSGMFVFMIFMSIDGQAQEQQQYVFASQGNYTESGDMSVSWTIGDSFITTVESSDGTLTQGFQQSFLKIKKVQNIELASFNAQVFPNPTSGILNVRLEDEVKEYTMEILDVTGKLMHKSNENQRLVEMDMTSYASGQYFIRLFNLNEKTMSIFEIIKLK